METRVCKYCGLEKPISVFHTKNMCALCRITRKVETSKNRRIDKKDELNAQSRQYYKENKTAILEQKANYREDNKEPLRIYAREHQKIYRVQNPGKVLASNKTYRENNKENKKEYDKKYWSINKVKRLAQVIANHYRRLKEDPAYKLRSIVSISIGRNLKSLGSSKGGLSILKFLPYTIQELKAHLEQQFEPWMTWNNYGTYRSNKWNDNDSTTWTWQIDHIIPHSKFHYMTMEDQAFRDCWALSNLRPYSAKQNLIDGDRK